MDIQQLLKLATDGQIRELELLSLEGDVRRSPRPHRAVADAIFVVLWLVVSSNAGTRSFTELGSVVTVTGR